MGNIEKMSRGEPLNDADRVPWLDVVRETGAKHITADGGAIVACSALKKQYRQILKGEEGGEYNTWFVWIKGEKSVLKERMEKRQGHYMKASMLDSQFADLEPPEGEDGVVTVPLELSPEKQLQVAREGLSKLVGTPL